MVRTVVFASVVAWSMAGLAAAQEPQNGDRLSGGNGTLYLGAYPQQITVVDEATEQVVDTIHVSIGVPRQLTLSEDLSRFYMIDATYEKFEAIDVATHESLFTFTLSEGNRRARLRSYRVHPDGRHVALVVDTAVKLIDRFEIEPRKFLLYDLEQDEVARELAWPTTNERGASRMLFSPDGEFLYYFDNDIVVLETDNYTEVDRWAISESIEDGLGRLTLSFTQDLINEEPGFFSGIFRVHDDLQDRDLMGIARIDLPGREVDFYTIGPSRTMSFALAPGRKMAYGIASEIGNYEFWTFDLAGRKIVSRRPFSGRPRMDLHVSTNGQVLYISQAGNTIDLYDADTQDYLRTITFDGDQTTGMIVVP
jgi:hypothetical protein